MGVGCARNTASATSGPMPGHVTAESRIMSSCSIASTVALLPDSDSKSRRKSLHNGLCERSLVDFLH